MRKTGKIAYVVLMLAVMVFCLTSCKGQEKDMPSDGSAPSSDSISQNGGKPDTADTAKGEPQATSDGAGKSETGVEASKTDGAGNSGNTDNSGITDNSGNTDSSGNTVTADANGNRVLVAYFSATGTTKKLAEYAAQVTGADLYEIVPAEPYTDADLNYNDRKSRTSIEMNDKSIKPAISGNISDMSQYDIVFIGYPIWWGDAPHIIDTFMESYDFSGKTIVPFCTSGSSGIGSSAKNLHDYTDGSVTWLDGARLKSSLSKEEMADWIRGLSLGIEVK